MTPSNPPSPAPRARLLPGLSLRVGDVLTQRYRLESLLSAESARIHIEATQSVTRAPVTIEIFMPEGEGADQARLAFIAASRKAAVLSGPHICRLLDTGVTADGAPFVVREPSPSRTLASVLEDTPCLDVAVAVDIAIAICDALTEAHDHHMVHGTLEAANVLLEWTESGATDVRVNDFATGLIFAELASDPASRLAIRAPEQLRTGGRVDARTDVFALGALLFTMIAGASPFAADSPSGTALAMNNGESAFLAGVDDALADLVEQCLASDRDKRPEDAAAIAKRLASFATPRSLNTLARIADRAESQACETLLIPLREYETLAKEKTAESVIPADVDEKGPTLVPVSASIAPVASDRPTVTMLKPSSESAPRWQGAGWFAAAACLVAGVGIGATSSRWMQNAPTTSTAAAEELTTSMSPVTIASAVVETAPPAVAPSPKPASTAPPPPKAIVTARAFPVQPVPAVSAASIVSAVPAAPAAVAQKLENPKPKENDDDLRHFLDDRR